MSERPNPGSKEAIAAGCICPVLDNARGKGCGTREDGTTVFWYTGGCTVHKPLDTEDEGWEP